MDNDHDIQNPLKIQVRTKMIITIIATTTIIVSIMRKMTTTTIMNKNPLPRGIRDQIIVVMTQSAT